MLTAFSAALLPIAREFTISISVNGRDGGIEHAPATTCHAAAKMNELDTQQSKPVSPDSVVSEKNPFQGGKNSSMILFMLEVLKKESSEWLKCGRRQTPS